MTSVAGHTLAPTPRGHGCTGCGRTWVEIIDQRARWIVGERDIAHVGELNARECQELQDYDAQRQALIWDAVTGRSTVDAP